MFLKGKCHCGAVKFMVKPIEDISAAARCNCSFCAMRGAVVSFAKVSDLQITSGAANLTEYQFNTKTAKHYFCRICGIYTHHQTRIDPNMMGFNVACIENMSPFDITEVPVMDGQNHQSDSGYDRQAGMLIYRPSI